MTEVLVGSDENKGLAEEIITELSDEQKNAGTETKAQSKEIDLT